MKKYFVALSVLFSLKALACVPNALVILHVKDVVQNAHGCEFAVEMKKGDVWKADVTCPLDNDLLSSVVLPDSSCSIKEGARVDGVLRQLENGRFDLY